MAEEIEFRNGPTGERAALRDGPDVWEVVATYRSVGNRVEPTARHLGLEPDRVDAALAHYRSNPAPVDARLRSEIELAARAYAKWTEGRST